MKCANPECGKQFNPTPRGKKQVYCCNPCMKRHWYLRNIDRFKVPIPKPRTCAQCDTMFTPKHDRAKYCTKLCGERARRVKEKGKRSNEKCCGHCNTVFKTSSFKKIFCSIQCAHQHHEIKRPKKVKTRRKSFGVRSCIICGTPFHPLWDSPNKKSTTCDSMECRRLSDKGILEMINKHNPIKLTLMDIEPGTIEAQREYIKIKRLIKQQTNERN